MRPGSGRELSGHSVITADNIADYVPAPHDLAVARALFEQAGFEIGEPVGIGFSITGPLGLFERFFGTRVGPAEDGGYGAFAGDEGRRELPLATLPGELTQRLIAVTFEPPAQLFGPGEVGS